MLKDGSRSFALLTPLRGAPSCSAQDDRGLGGLCFRMSRNRDLWHPAVMLEDESRSFAPLTPLRVAPSCSAQDDRGWEGHRAMSRAVLTERADHTAASLAFL